MRWKQLLYSSLSIDLVLDPLRRRTASSGITVLAYHDLAPDGVDIEAWTVVRESDFLRQMDYLMRYYNVVSLDQALARMCGSIDTVRPLAVVTFDDGASGSTDVLLPIVEACRIPVTIYVATRQIVDGTPYWFDQLINGLQVDATVDVNLQSFGLGRYRINEVRGPRNWNEIERLLEALKSLDPARRPEAVQVGLSAVTPGARRRNGRVLPMEIADVQALAGSPLVTIGSHSHCHSILTQLAPDQASHSICESKALLEKWTGRTVEHFAYPNGSHDENTISIVRNLGFRSAVTFEWGVWRSNDSLFRIPRISVGRYDSLAQYRLNVAGGLRSLYRRAA